MVFLSASMSIVFLLVEMVFGTRYCLLLTVHKGWDDMQLDYLVARISGTSPAIVPSVRPTVCPSITIALTGGDSTAASPVTNARRQRNVSTMANIDTNRMLN